MARPERKTVDYFPHFISDGKKMFFIEHKYGNNGYSTWFKLLESLAITEDHFLNFNNESDLMFMSAKCRIDENLLLDILNDLAKLGEINAELWSVKIVWSEKFVESIQDAYTRRNNKCMTYEGLCIHLLGLGITITPQSAKKTYNNPQSKVKETKEDTPLTPKGELNERETKFLIWFNGHIKTKTGKIGKFRTLSETDKKNLKKLRNAHSESDDWDKAFNGMWNSKWCQETGNVTPTHLLRVDNFNKYLNGQASGSTSAPRLTMITIADHD